MIRSKEDIDQIVHTLLNTDKKYLDYFIEEFFKGSANSITSIIGQSRLIEELQYNYELGELHPSDIFTTEQLKNDAELEVSSSFVRIGGDFILSKKDISRVGKYIDGDDYFIQCKSRDTDLHNIFFLSEQQLALEFNRVKSILYRFSN